MANATPIVTGDPTPTETPTPEVKPKATKGKAKVAKEKPRSGTKHVPLPSGGFSVEKV